MRVLRSVIPPPMLPSNKHSPEKVVGNRKAAMALVSMALSRDVLLVKVLAREQWRNRNLDVHKVPQTKRRARI